MEFADYQEASQYFIKRVDLLVMKIEDLENDAALLLDHPTPEEARRVGEAIQETIQEVKA